MKRFLHMLLRFSIIPVLCILLLEGGIAFRRQNLLKEEMLEKVFTNSGNEYAWVSSVKHPRKVLLTGSSSVKYGLSCTLLNELSGDSLAFINLAADARDPIKTYFILKHISLDSVQRVYFALDPWIFSRAYYRNRNSYLYLDMSTAIAAKYSSEHDSRLFPGRYKAVFRSLLPARPSASKVWTVPPDLGSASLDRKPINFDDPVHKKFQVDKYGWSDLQFEYLQKIQALCKSRNIEFITIYTPKRSDFIEDYKKNCREIHVQFMQKLKAVSVEPPLAETFESLKQYGDSIFADAYHLNKEGQRLYSILFIKHKIPGQ